MKRMKVLSALIVFLFLQIISCAQEYPYLNDPSGLTGVTPASGITEPVTVKVIYDNYVHTEGMKADWGFSIVVSGLDKTVLFDTGTRPEIFESNFNEMGIDPYSIDAVVFSHEHLDHIGGMSAFIKMKSGIPVIMPDAFPAEFKRKMADAGMKPLLVREPAMICEHLYTSGVFDFPLAEQALVLDTKRGLVVMTGCSHPGIVDMLKEIKARFNKTPYMVFGGFHLLNKSDKEMEKIIEEMKAIGVVRCGATHCTGDRQIKLIKEAFGDNYFELGVGNILTISQ
jgi:7,8-dihydropterin-6-yl-methyl-4-(beta-D-ribofuranosyl)aminobenzene 5'-phosphate synthase